MKGRGKRKIPEEIHRPTASCGTIPTCENPVTRPGIEPGSPWWPWWPRDKHSGIIAGGRKIIPLNVSNRIQCSAVCSTENGCVVQLFLNTGGAVARALVSHQGDLSSIPGGFTPGFSHVGILLDDAACRAGFLGVLPLPPLLHMSGDDGHLEVPAGKPVTRRVLPRPGLTAHSSFIYLHICNPTFDSSTHRRLSLSSPPLFASLTTTHLTFKASTTLQNVDSIEIGENIDSGSRRAYILPARRPYPESSSFPPRVALGKVRKRNDLSHRELQQPSRPAPRASCSQSDDEYGRIEGKDPPHYFTSLPHIPTRLLSLPDFRMWQSCPMISPSGDAPCSPHFVLIGSQDLSVKSRPNLYTLRQAPRNVHTGHAPVNTTCVQYGPRPGFSVKLTIPGNIAALVWERHDKTTRRNERAGQTRRPAASPGTIPTCENAGATRPRVEPGSPRWEVSGYRPAYQAGSRELQMERHQRTGRPRTPAMIPIEDTPLLSSCTGPSQGLGSRQKTSVRTCLRAARPSLPLLSPSTRSVCTRLEGTSANGTSLLLCHRPEMNLLHLPSPALQHTVHKGAAVAERLDYWPPNKAYRIQSPAESLTDFRQSVSCLTMPLVGMFSRDSPFPQWCSILAGVYKFIVFS
ncbi:hypothetical protein PR048_006482 [Dryococelus australis]|uniref:Uncharacterized protein n=1 Tax=Dryococelus australis TaxID=614101 RepID=A0ABQ9IB68_9NEOP|nr:hypothetical protein PR048_006482 [Dryococelus australis]